MGSVEITYRYGLEMAEDRRRPADAAAARARLEAGNLSFAALLDSLAQDRAARQEIAIDARDVGLAEGWGEPRQRPYAAILGCADARVPLELLFGEGPNDLFVVRVAGNVLGAEVLGSLRYAAAHLGGLSTAVVLGHSGCGAVAAAVDLYLSPASVLALATDHALRAILERIMLVVQAAANGLRNLHGALVHERPGYRAALCELAIALNAALGAHMLSRELAPLSLLYGVYVVAARRVRAPCAEAGERDGLAEPPADADAFRAIFARFAASPRIAGLLDAAEPGGH